MEEKIPLILCKLQRIFPPGLFYSMEHLIIHLPFEARVCGPVQYRWMYSFERFLNKIKKTIKNKSRVEGSICQAYLAQEISYFASHYFESHVLSSNNRVDRNDDLITKNATQPTLSVFNLSGRSYGKKKGNIQWLDDKEVVAAQLHVLINCDKVKPFLKFDPHKIVIKGIASCIRSKFEYAKPLWKKFLESTHDMWFEEFKIEMSSSTAATSNTSKRRARKSIASSRRVWTPKEELTLVDGLKELCVNGWRGDNGTFRHGYLMELEHYMNSHHPNFGLESLPHVDSKIRAWKKSYATISLLKGRSGLGFQYSDGIILVDDPKAWDDLIKVDPNAKSMDLRKCQLFADWKEIFGKDRATGEFAEGQEDTVEEIERIEAQEITNGMSVGFPIVVVEVDDPSDTREDQTAQEEPNVSTGATQSPFTAQVEPNESTGAAQSSFTTQKGETHQSQKQGNNFKASSSKVNEKGRCKKRRTVEDDNETVLKGLMEVMKQFTESHDKRLTFLIDKLGKRNLSEIRGKIFSIIGSSTFEIYNSDERVKAAMGITQDIKRKEFFLTISELECHSMIWMIINDKL
ncbi:uncharacterized protein LOC125869906 [Solanum stenotomum]|uniref:uncharacterized protein LOC125869906 n=1 Tax=Solanum stenotomum TaxID=172797 RepID=UPI0020D0C67D|nr:uncharacterized protein LOC125869906 [Solanum stenotomum]